MLVFHCSNWNKVDDSCYFLKSYFFGEPCSVYVVFDLNIFLGRYLKVNGTWSENLSRNNSLYYITGPNITKEFMLIFFYSPSSLQQLNTIFVCFIFIIIIKNILSMIFKSTKLSFSCLLLRCSSVYSALTYKHQIFVLYISNLSFTILFFSTFW